MALALHARFGRVAAQAPLVAAALLAADGSRDGFRLTDVQFFFYLFGNWIERDALRAGDRLELTQVRRVLRRLQRDGAVTARGRPPRHRLTGTGIGELVTGLADAPATATFAECVFVATFFRCYGAAIAPRAPAKVRPLLDPDRVARRARERASAVLADLEERIRSSRAVAQVAANARARGADAASVAAAVEGAGAYQLQHVRAFASFAGALPEPLRSFELGPAFALRAELLFETFAATTRAELAAWERLRARLA